MSITYPTTLDTFSNPVSTDLVENANPLLDHDRQHSDANDAIEALEAKVGVTSSAVTTSHDYKLGEVTSSDKAVGKTATQTLTNKTISGASNTLTIREADFSFTDITTADVSTTKHGLVPKAPNISTKFLRGDATWAVVQVNVYTGTGSYDLSTASSGTNVFAHGLAIAPKFVRIRGFSGTTGTSGSSLFFGETEALYSASTQSGYYRATTTGDGAAGSSQIFGSGFRIYSEYNAGNPSYYQSGVITVDATNITITWTKTGSPTGSGSLLVEAIA